MFEIDYFYNTLQSSVISLLGYTFKHERVKDQIISKIPHIVIEDIHLDFSLKSHLRNEKLNHLFQGVNFPKSNTKWFVLDTLGIKATSDHLGGREKTIQTVLNKIRSELLQENAQNQYKLLITCPVHSSPKMGNVQDFSGGNTQIYISDFVTIIQDNHLDIIKNRLAGAEVKISLDKLPNYSYICNYENC